MSRTFPSQPARARVVYTTYNRATLFAPKERKLLSFVLVKAKPRVALCETIRRGTRLAAYSREEFKKVTYIYFMKYTGIPINFGIAVVLGFIVGTVLSALLSVRKVMTLEPAIAVQRLIRNAVTQNFKTSLTYLTLLTIVPPSWERRNDETGNATS